MELKYIPATILSIISFSFNRTTYGIEILFDCFVVSVFASSFNRTTYGIEMTVSPVYALCGIYLLIVPLMELKFRYPYPIIAE